VTPGLRGAIWPDRELSQRSYRSNARSSSAPSRDAAATEDVEVMPAEEFLADRWDAKIV
jgi:hypothetical protein